MPPVPDPNTPAPKTGDPPSTIEDLYKNQQC